MEMSTPITLKNLRNAQSTLVAKFNLHLSNCCNILKSSGVEYSCENELDIYAIAYVISDFAVASAHKDRKLASDQILSAIFPNLSKLYADPPTELFRHRIDFYGEVIRGIDLHAHCLPGVDISDANPVLCCAIAFTDCLLVPAYMSNYSNTPAPLFSALEAMDVGIEVLEPLHSELVSLHNEMFTCAGVRTDQLLNGENKRRKSQNQTSPHNNNIWQCKKSKSTKIAVVTLIAVILLQILIVHPGIAVNSVYAIGTPLALIEYGSHALDQALGLTAYNLPDYNSSICKCQRMERITRDTLSGSTSQYLMEDRVSQALIYLLIWVFMFIEISKIVLCIMRSAKLQHILFLITSAISVNLWAEIMYLAFGYVNAVISFGISFALFMLLCKVFDRQH